MIDESKDKPEADEIKDKPVLDETKDKPEADEIKDKPAVDETKVEPEADEIKDKPAAGKIKEKEKTKEKKGAEVVKYSAVGRRKEGAARVTLIPGKGDFKVNKRTLDDYFPRETLRMIIQQPLEICNLSGKYDVIVLVRGGGTAAQAGAIRHGISRALVKADETLRKKLKKAGFLTRDPRMKERKKYGQEGARRKFQFSKR